MEKLLNYLNRLPKERRLQFASACGTSEGYLRKAISMRQPLGSNLCIKIDRESAGDVSCEDLRPDVDWAYLRASATYQSNHINHITETV
ncbi:MAG TPA: YdaS family helix-turn-helix protein [Burkholderiaceae bacterium]|jgi:DNA-binding transcriptional regulator YdaS (Cro superfamily)|nr:YdaS family helix-turn-helix protein [Burkholderiaceae bacterium]